MSDSSGSLVGEWLVKRAGAIREIFNAVAGLVPEPWVDDVIVTLILAPTDKLESFAEMMREAKGCGVVGSGQRYDKKKEACKCK